MSNRPTLPPTPPTSYSDGVHIRKGLEKEAEATFEMAKAHRDANEAGVTMQYDVNALNRRLGLMQHTQTMRAHALGGAIQVTLGSSPFLNRTEKDEALQGITSLADEFYAYITQDDFLDVLAEPVPDEDTE